MYSVFLNLYAALKPWDDVVKAGDDDVDQDGVAQRPDRSGKSGLNVETKSDQTDRKYFNQIVQAEENVLHGRVDVAEGPGFAGIHQIGQLVDRRKNVRFWNTKIVFIYLMFRNYSGVDL